MGEEDDFSVVPDMGFTEAREEDFGELSAGAFAVGIGCGVLGNGDVGVGEVGVSADEVRPVGVVGGAERVFVAVNAVDEDDDAWTEELLSCWAEIWGAMMRARMMVSVRLI